MHAKGTIKQNNKKQLQAVGDLMEDRFSGWHQIFWLFSCETQSSKKFLKNCQFPLLRTGHASYFTFSFYHIAEKAVAKKSKKQVLYFLYIGNYSKVW